MLNLPQYETAVACFVQACWWSRNYTDLFKAAIKEHGDIGPDISGAGRDHFPDLTKDMLRQSARNVRIYSDAGHAARPKYVRQRTMNHLASLVATRDGSGFYGPQPYRAKGVAAIVQRMEKV